MLGDLDTFFVAVERLHRPELAQQPVVIGGRPGQRGVVAACSYEARQFGIRSAMPMGTAYQLAQRAGAFERVAWLHENLHGNYSLYSKRVQDILRDSVPVFQARSIDEFRLDITGCERLFGNLYGGIVPFAEHLRRRVRGEVGLPLSFGIGPSAIVAKMASRRAKPDGVHRVLPEDVAAFLGPHDVQTVPGIGPVTAEKLRNLGLTHVQQLLGMPRTALRALLGNGFAGLVDTLLEGGGSTVGTAFMPSAMSPSGTTSTAALKRGDDILADEYAADAMNGVPARPKSIGHETTFERDLLDPALLEETLWMLTEDACRRLRDKGLKARHVTVKLRYSDFATHTHGGFFDEPTDVDSIVFERVRELFWRAHRRLRVRLVGVRLERLTPDGNQPGLFDPPRVQREQRLVRTVDGIRARFGKGALLAGPGVWQLVHGKVQADATAGVPSAFLPEGR